MKTPENFAVDGYAIFPDVIGDVECDTVHAAINSWNGSRSRAGVRHLMVCPAVENLAMDLRLLQLASRCLAEPAFPYRATLFEKSLAASWLVPWHQDTALPLTAKFKSPEWGRWSIKAGIVYAHAPAWALERIVALRVHLGASNTTNGPLQVIPGSHRAGVYSDEDIDSLRKSGPIIDCVVGKGVVLAMRPLLLHASSKTQSNVARPVLHIEYAPRVGLGMPVVLAMA